VRDNIFAFWERVEPDARIHPADSSVLSRVKDHGFELNCLPLPFFGPLRSAEIILLHLAPGFADAKLDEARTPDGQQRHVRIRQGREPLPGPDVCQPTWAWWVGRTKCFGKWAELRARIAVLELVPYHSKGFRGRPMLSALPSVRASIEWAQAELFPDAIAGRRTVICLRAAQHWGLSVGKRYGEALFAPQTARNGLIMETPLRSQILVHVQKVFAQGCRSRSPPLMPWDSREPDEFRTLHPPAP
jgi:hypothetical protein